MSPIGMWVAPSMCPCIHSSSSRTSRTTASSGSSLAYTGGTCCGITHSIVARAGAERVGLPGWLIMTTPVREPAWSLSRSAIGLWVTESIAGTVFLGLAVGAFLLFVPSDVGGPVPALRWIAPIGLVLYALVAIGVR